MLWRCHDCDVCDMTWPLCSLCAHCCAAFLLWLCSCSMPTPCSSPHYDGFGSFARKTCFAHTQKMAHISATTSCLASMSSSFHIACATFLLSPTHHRSLAHREHGTHGQPPVVRLLPAVPPHRVRQCDMQLHEHQHECQRARSHSFAVQANKRCVSSSKPPLTPTFLMVFRQAPCSSTNQSH